MTAEICACDSNIATANYRIRLKIEIPARKKNVLFQLYEFIPENVGWCVICLCALFFFLGDRRRLTSYVKCWSKERYNDISKGASDTVKKERLLSAERIIWGSSSIIKYTICSCVNVWMLFYFIFMSFALFWNTHIYACFPCGTAIRVAGSSGDISSSTSRSFQRKLLKSQYDDARLWYSRWKKVILQNFFW